MLFCSYRKIWPSLSLHLSYAVVTASVFSLTLLCSVFTLKKKKELHKITNRVRSLPQTTGYFWINDWRPSIPGSLAHQSGHQHVLAFLLRVSSRPAPSSGLRGLVEADDRLATQNMQWTHSGLHLEGSTLGYGGALGWEHCPGSGLPAHQSSTTPLRCGG